VADHEPRTKNEAVSWASFDAAGYWKTNYATVLPEDAEIIRFASEFLIGACRDRPPVTEAVDVGAGANLYPALLMLPWAEKIVFTEYAPANIEWLREQLARTSGEWPWQPFWDLMADQPGHVSAAEPRRRLAARHEVRRGSIFELPRRAWGLGSMFFVADGMTSDQAEFERAVRSFLGALTPGAPFLMAFMEGSRGYDVSGIPFPAVTITLESLAGLLAGLPVTGTSVLRTNNAVRPVRPGYDAMLLATGYVMPDGPRREPG
jgi:hypothetical protein